MNMFSLWIAFAAAAVWGAHYLVFAFVPMEATMGAVQRIFYFHVPSAWLCFLGFLLCFGGSITYLINRSSRSEIFALASAEVGLIFGGIVLTTGPLWARAAWGVWWKWEPRLTSMALLVLIFAAYWVLRHFGGRGQGVKLFASLLAVLGTPNIFFVHYAVKKWRGDHPDDVIARSDPDMRLALYLCLSALLVVFILSIILRYRTHRDRATVSAIRRRVSRLGGLT